MRDNTNKKQIECDQLVDNKMTRDSSTQNAEEKHQNAAKKRIKPGCLIALLILAVILIGGGILVGHYFSLIRAFYQGITSTPDSIATEITKSKEQTVQALSESGIEISAEDMERAESGEMSEEEIAQMIYDAMKSGSSTNAADKQQTDQTGAGSAGSDPDDAQQSEDSAPADAPDKPDKKDEQKNDKPKSDKQDGKENGASSAKKTGKLTDEEIDRRVSELVAQVYVLKGQYTGLLSSFEASAKAQYAALPPEQHNAAGKAKIVSDNMGYVAGLEAQCDAQMSAITTELFNLLKDNGRDTSLVDSINAAYISEKELKKAYYISLYK